MEIILNCLKISFAITFIQLVAIYLPYLLANTEKRKTIKLLTPFRPLDFLFLSFFLFFIALLASPFDNPLHIGKNTVITYFYNWVFAVIASSYFFVIYPFLLKLQHKRFEISVELQKRYTNTFNSTIPVYVTTQTFYNAFASGFLPFNRIIIIGKSISENLTKEEEFAILCHEQGHHKANDLFVFFGFVACSVIFFLVGRDLFIHLMAGVFPKLDGGLVIGIFGSIHSLIFYCILFPKISHRAEFAADLYAAKYAGAANIISALHGLNTLTGGLLDKGSLTHPSLENRIENIRKYYA